MIRSVAVMFVAALAVSAVACGDERTEEETGRSEEALDINCLKSARTREAVEACLGQGGGLQAPPQGGGGGGGGGQSCSTSISCVNGACKCGDGRACEMSQCSTVCRVCK